MERYDLFVIGAGPGGYAAAIRAAQLGRRVAVAEREALGGVCLNWGCIPTKALLHSAQVYRTCRTAAAFGIAGAGEAQPEMRAIVARSRAVAETMSRGIAFLLQKHKIDVISGTARLAGRGCVEVDGTRFAADHILLATGARPRELPGLPVDHVHVLNSKDALQLDVLPVSLAVVGSGAIGCEFASLYAQLGVQVTLIEYQPQLMPLEDEEVARTMERAFRKQRVAVMTSTTVKGVEITPEGTCVLAVEGKRGAAEVRCDKVLSAVGIEANLEGLGLEEAGVRVERGKIAVDERYRTSAEGIYAIGDIIPGPALAHVATAEAICCVESICGLAPQPVDYATIPSCIFTAPEVASVGRTEQQLRAEGVAYKVGRFPFTASGKATAAGERDGFVKLLFGDGDRLLGAHLVGAHVTEMLAEPTLAQALGTTAHAITRTIHAHPTMQEGVMEAAAAALGEAIHV